MELAPVGVIECKVRVNRYIHSTARCPRRELVPVMVRLKFDCLMIEADGAQWRQLAGNRLTDAFCQVVERLIDQNSGLTFHSLSYWYPV